MISGKSFIRGEWEEGLGLDITSLGPSTKTKIKDYKGVEVAKIDRHWKVLQRHFQYRSVLISMNLLQFSTILPMKLKRRGLNYWQVVIKRSVMSYFSI
ncbi:hypothetical protein N9954_05985 [Maribacter sp.]|nr:hypothetical protein [Maribacter sp.]